SYGLVLGGAEDRMPLDGVSGRVTGNVFLQGDDISSSLPRGTGLQLGNLNGVVVSGNIFSKDASAKPHGSAISIDPSNGGGIRNTVISDNVIDDWNGNIRIFWGDAIDNLVIRDNKIYDSRGQTEVVRFSEDNFSSEIKFINNQYDSTRN